MSTFDKHLHELRLKQLLESMTIEEVHEFCKQTLEKSGEYIVSKRANINTPQPAGLNTIKVSNTAPAAPVGTSVYISVPASLKYQNKSYDLEKEIERKILASVEEKIKTPPRKSLLNWTPPRKSLLNWIMGS